MRNQIGSYWSGFNFAFGMDGNPRTAFVRTWKAANIQVMANVTFEATEYDGNQFSETVTVTMSPEASLAPLMSLQSELSKRPDVIFILSKQVGGNPFDLTDANIAARPDMDVADPIVVSYFEAIDKILKEYEGFRNKYRIGQ